MSEIRSMFKSEQAKKNIEKLQTNCQSNGVQFVRNDFHDIEAYKLTISKKDFCDYDLYISNEEDLDVALCTDFQNIGCLESVVGYVDLSKGVIEVAIIGSSLFGTINKKRLLGEGKDELMTTSLAQPLIRIGLESDLCCELRGGASTKEFSITLKRVKVESASEAEDLVKKYCSNLFLSILAERKIGLRLRRRIKKGFSSRVAERKLQESGLPPEFKLEYPTFSLPFVPVSLIMAASDPFLPPSFQYLLNYQVLEFFWFRSNRAEAFQTIKGVLEDKEFKPSCEEQLLKLLRTIKPAWVNPLKGELDQLEILINKDELLESIKAHLNANPNLKDHFSDSHKFTDQKVLVDLGNKEFSKKLAFRIYNIRNSIVHMKEDELGLRSIFLLQSSDEEIIDLDSAFLSFLAKEALKVYGRESF